MKKTNALRRLGAAAAAAMAALMAASPANAALVFDTPSGSTTTGGSVDAVANFALGSGAVTLTLQNLLQNPMADSQLISAITFEITLATGSGASTANSGLISTISSGGAYTAGQQDSLGHWTLTEAGTTISLTTLSGGQPNRLIIGPDSAGGFTQQGSYNNANPSIINHNPSVLGSATFDLTIPGVTAASQISDVAVQFGTTAGANTIDMISAVPEPGTTLAGLFLLLPFAASTVRTSRRWRAR